MGYGKVGYGAEKYYAVPNLVAPPTGIQTAWWQIDENVGLALTPSKDAFWSIDENVGLALTPINDAYWGIDENIQVSLPSTGAAVFQRVIRRRGL